MKLSTGFVATRLKLHIKERNSQYIQEKNRQKHFINLIPSENFTSQAVLDALGSVMQSTCPATLTPYQAYTA
jgi:glycine hydroxymethyltransferase